MDRRAKMRKILFLTLIAMGSSLGEPYNPNFLMNMGFGYFPMDKNVVEVSEWFNVSKIADISSGKYGSKYWLGFDQGIYLDSPEKSGYFEIQMAYQNNKNATSPGGISAGLIKNKNGSNDWKGSIWISLPFVINVTGLIGIETFNETARSKLNLGAFIKIPIFACCDVLGMP